MKLTRLELNGFKSFADPIELTFESGITAIVGPNGCGKSNISDAVRWVLGEQRARLLRSSRMDEVIFQGSVKRRPINIAEVSLVFDNEDGALDIPYTEVVVARRLSRSGQSDYLLNQSPTRLRDLQDLLRGTGLGSEAGVVIEAQMIDRLLSDRPEERRSLFEEAAGIGFYRDRKATTERRLEQTMEDLQRLEDVISEVQTQVRSLARQRGKAERHEKYASERFAIVMTLARTDLAGFERRNTELRTRTAKLRTELPARRTALSDLGRQRDQLVQERATAEARRNELERRLGETRLAVQKLEADLQLSAERLEHQSERKQRAAEERTEAAARVERISRELEAARSERLAAEDARKSVQTELDLRTASEVEVRDHLQSQRNIVRELETSLQAVAESVRALSGERGTLERDLEELGAQESLAAARKAEAERELDTVKAEHERSAAAVLAREREEHTAANELERARDALSHARQRQLELRAALRELEDTIALDSARREALEELERNREGLAPAAQALLAARNRFGGGAILGPLSDYVKASPDAARRAEHLLADWLHAVLVRDLDAVRAIKQWHRDARPGPLLLLPVAPGPTGSSRTEIAELRIASPADAWARALLAGDELDSDEGVAVRRANGAVFLPADTSGLLSRRAELDHLADSLTGARERLTALAAQAESATGAYEAAELALAAASEINAKAKAGLREAQGMSDDTQRRLLRAERERAEASDALARLHERVADRQARAQHVAEELTARETERARLDERLGTERSALADAEAAQESARERRVHWQVEEAQVSAREQAAREREERALAELEAAERARVSLGEELQGLDTSGGQLRDQRAEWTDALAERQTTVTEMADALEESQTAVGIAEERLQHQDRALEEERSNIERLSEELHALELELTQAEGRRQALVERIEGEWHKPLDELLASSTPIEDDPDSLRDRERELAKVLEEMGPVNPLAVHEHAEEVARVEFLTTQRDDLVAARASLIKALREIDETARSMFLETFAAIRENFHRVFHTLFDGGECDVRLADEADPLMSDIDIHAAPRGKRTQRIHLLSSGERALVAVSLLFSIYLTKPAPFCLLDEVDAPLDDANVMRFVRLLNEFKADTQFIVITHNPRTMQVADAVYGVTMQEPGVSTIVGVRLGEAQATLV